MQTTPSPLAQQGLALARLLQGMGRLASLRQCLSAAAYLMVSQWRSSAASGSGGSSGSSGVEEGAHFVLCAADTRGVLRVFEQPLVGSDALPRRLLPCW